MNLEGLVKKLRKQTVQSVKKEDLIDVLSAAEVVAESDTHFSGPIRILSLAGMLIVQEQTPEGEIILRRVPSRREADRFVADRLAAYDRMWDGCGCRIDYHR